MTFNGISLDDLLQSLVELFDKKRNEHSRTGEPARVSLPEAIQAIAGAVKKHKADSRKTNRDFFKDQRLDELRELREMNARVGSLEAAWRQGAAELKQRGAIKHADFAWVP